MPVLTVSPLSAGLSALTLQAEEFRPGCRDCVLSVSLAAHPVGRR